MTESNQHSAQRTSYHQVLADFFQLEAAVVAKWLGREIGDIRLPFCCASQHDALYQALLEAGLDAAPIKISTQVNAKITKVKRQTAVKNVIAVASGKGGVGKSATAVNLAFALQQEGAKVGIVDADIYGPSIPIMLGNPAEAPESPDGKHMKPLFCHGLVANSVGYLIPAEKAAIWRGPMASRALQQVVNDTLWPELDYLIVDMPPGTGDIQLTLAEQLPVTGAVIVTTPQDLALADARKGIAMFERVSVPVLGVVENMSYYLCRKCGHQEAIFATGGGQRISAESQRPLLGQLPLDITIREHADGGTPLLIAQPESALAQAYRSVARTLSREMALLLEDDDSLIIPTVEKR